MMEKKPAVQLLSQEEQIVEFKYEGQIVEIFLNNYISSEKGFFLWEKLDASIQKLATDLFNIQKLTELQTHLVAQTM